MRIIKLLLFFTLLVSPVAASTIILEGKLDKEKLLSSEKLLDDGTTVLIINSSSGEIEPTLAFAQKVRTHGKKVVVYIDENAVGPAGVLPFLADELYVSSFVTWGDLYLGTDLSYPLNVYKSQVLELISKKDSILKTMALGMIDDQLLLVDEEGLKSYYKDNAPKSPILAKRGERLVLGQRRLSHFKMVDGVMSLKKFEKRFSLPKTVEVREVESAAVDDPRSTLAERLKKHISYSETEKNIVGHIYIGDQKESINQGTWLYVRQALEYYKKIKPIFIIMELNTPGGEVYSAQKISDALKEIDTQYDIPIVAMIDNWAISAGVMLTYSSRFITLTKDASLGAAEPVMKTTEGMKTASEKVNSALRADFSNRASFYGRNPLIAESMVDKEILLVLRNGKFIKLESKDDVRASDVVISQKGKLLTLNANQIMEYGVGDIKMEPTKRPQITSSEKSEGKWAGEKMALFYQPFFKEIPNVVVDSYKPDWKTMILKFLASPVVASGLFMALMVGFYVEINSPGFGIPGAIGLTALFLIILSSFALDAVNWLELIVVGVGVLLLLVDLFLIPSFGVIGGLGILMMLGGILALMVPGLENVSYEFGSGTLNAAGDYAINRLAWISLGFVLGLIVIAILARYLFPFLAPYSRFVLAGGEQDASHGYVSGVLLKDLPTVDSVGVAQTDLRRTGHVEIDGKLYDAISDGTYIYKGTKIVVIRHDGNVLIVDEES